MKNGFISGMELMPLQSENFLLLYFFCFTVQICDDDNGDVAGDKAVQHVIDDSKFVSIAHLVYIMYALSFGCGEHETVGFSSIVILLHVLTFCFIVKTSKSSSLINCGSIENIVSLMLSFARPFYSYITLWSIRYNLQWANNPAA